MRRWGRRTRRGTQSPGSVDDARLQRQPIIHMTATADDVASLPWVQALRPTRAPYVAQLSSYSALAVWHVDVQFTEWPVSRELAERWKEEKLNAAETWRKRPLAVGVDSGCAPSCGEVELAARLRKAGYEAFWISEWQGFPHVECWRTICVKRGEMKARTPELWLFDQQLRDPVKSANESLGRSGGHPDIAAWRPETREFSYLEYKGPGDSFNRKQDAWARSILSQVTPRLPYLAVRGTFGRRS
jgi:hypothetical protein